MFKILKSVLKKKNNKMRIQEYCFIDFFERMVINFFKLSPSFLSSYLGKTA